MVNCDIFTLDTRARRIMEHGTVANTHAGSMWLAEIEQREEPSVERWKRA